MPSDDNDDEAEYSVFGNDAANTPEGSGENAQVGPEAVDLGDGDDGCPKCGTEL
jgi:hypothetical protein